MSEEKPRRLRSDDGQSAMEFALVLPVVAVFAVGLVQVGVSVRNQLAVELAAREGARAASVAADTNGAAVTAAARATTLEVAVTASVSGGAVAVTVEYADEIRIPLLGGLFPTVTHRATAVMTLEPP